MNKLQSDKLLEIVKSRELEKQTPELEAISYRRQTSDIRNQGEDLEDNLIKLAARKGYHPLRSMLTQNEYTIASSYAHDVVVFMDNR